MSALAPPAYLATFARPSEQRKNAAASCAGGKRPAGDLEPDRNGGLRDQLVEGLAEASFGERARVNAPREPEQLRSGGVEIARKLAQRLTGLPVTLRGEPGHAVA